MGAATGKLGLAPRPTTPGTWTSRRRAHQAPHGADRTRQREPESRSLGRPRRHRGRWECSSRRGAGRHLASRSSAARHARPHAGPGCSFTPVHRVGTGAGAPSAELHSVRLLGDPFGGVVRSHSGAGRLCPASGPSISPTGTGTASVRRPRFTVTSVSVALTREPGRVMSRQRAPLDSHRDWDCVSPVGFDSLHLRSGPARVPHI